MQVEQLMMKNVQCCEPGQSLEHAAQLMWDRDCGCLPVCDGEGHGHPIGMITDRDIAMCALFQGRALRDICVSEAMSHEVKTCHAHDTLAFAEKLMSEAKVRRLPVTDAEGTLVGMISLADLAQEVTRGRAGKANITESEVCRTLATICQPAVTAAAA